MTTDTVAAVTLLGADVARGATYVALMFMYTRDSAIRLVHVSIAAAVGGVLMLDRPIGPAFVGLFAAGVITTHGRELWRARRGRCAAGWAIGIALGSVVLSATAALVYAHRLQTVGRELRWLALEFEPGHGEPLAVVALSAAGALAVVGGALWLAAASYDRWRAFAPPAIVCSAGALAAAELAGFQAAVPDASPVRALVAVTVLNVVGLLAALVVQIVRDRSGWTAVWSRIRRR